jgi:hypothetical protein
MTTARLRDARMDVVAKTGVIITPEQDALLRSTPLSRPKLRALLGEALTEDQFVLLKGHYLVLRRAAKWPGAREGVPRPRNHRRVAYGFRRLPISVFIAILTILSGCQIWGLRGGVPPRILFTRASDDISKQHLSFGIGEPERRGI